MQKNIAVVSLTNIQKNAKKIRQLLPQSVKIYAVVKANAYGHGAVKAAEALESVADGFAVTDVSEGIALRIGGIGKEILVFTPPLDESDVFLSAAHDLTITVCGFASFRLALRTAEKFSLSLRAHLKVNTGMNRLGLCGAPFARLCGEVSEQSAIRTEGIYSHLYAPERRGLAKAQLDAFLREKERAEEKLGRLTAHLAATGGILQGEEFFLDAVRPGICLYGYTPYGFENTQKFLPAMKVYTHAVQSHRFTGGGVGYAAAEREYKDLTVCRLGYADGFLRRGGSALNAVGNLCMDGYIREGKSVFAKRRLVFSDAEKVARETGTIPYEVLCAATRRAYFEYR